VITAKNFLVVDGDGKPIAALGENPNGSALCILNKDGKPVVNLGATPSGGSFDIGNKDGKIVAVISVNKNEDAGALVILNENGKPLVAISVEEGAGILKTLNNKGELTSQLPEKRTTVSVCRNCVEDKIDISNPSTKGKMIQAILAGADSRYNLHSESDCKIEKEKPDHPDHPGN
jgi:hypothetical protein